MYGGATWAQEHGRDENDPHLGAVRDDGASPSTDDLPYRVELAAGPGSLAGRVIATALTPGIAYAAYYAAVREYP